MTYREQKQHLSQMASRLRDLSSRPENDRKRSRWARHNDLKDNAVPLFWVCPDDDGAWLQLVPEDRLLCEDPELRTLERKLSQYLYHGAHFADDMVFEPCVYWETPGEYTGYHYGNFSQKTAWGLPIAKEKTVWKALKMEEVIQTPADYETLMRHEVDFREDREEQARLSEKLNDAVDGVIAVRFQLPYSVLVQALLIDLVHLRGLQPLLTDLYDMPDLVEGALHHMALSKAALLTKLERERRLFDNRINIYTGSGALGYTTQPLKEDGEVLLKDMWGFADAQEFSHVSPGMFERFAISHQKIGLNLFGKGCYGCCEPLDNKYDAIYRHLSNLRRLSVSPWSDIELAAERIGRRAIYSWKPNPALVSGTLDEAAVTALLRRVRAATRDCFLEIILKDLRTLNGNQALLRFIALVNQVFDRPQAQEGTENG